jgi:HSP20 family protein
MSNLSRWEPVHEMMTLREAMDRLFDEAFTRPIAPGSGMEMPAVDLYQTDNEVVVKAALPGLNPDDINISVTADVLTLKGDYKQEDDVKDAQYHIREHRHGMFERSIMLPTPVQPDKARAEFDKGILSIQIPKTETVKPKTVNIKVK